MDTGSNPNIVEEFKKLIALNGSLSARLREHENIIKGRDNEIEMLQSMLTDATIYRSNLDNQVDELDKVQAGIRKLQQQVQGASFIGASRYGNISGDAETKLQLAELQLQYNYLQTQLTDLQKQLLELNNRNLVLQQQTSRISELESLLENAAEEINELRNRL